MGIGRSMRLWIMVWIRRMSKDMNDSISMKRKEKKHDEFCQRRDTCHCPMLSGKTYLL